MKPYYESENATLYLGDARSVELDQSVDLIATDPPYGVQFKSNRGQHPAMAGDDGTLDVPATLAGFVTGNLRKFRHVYVFGYSVEDLQEPLKLGGTTELVWDKGIIGMGALDLPWGPQHERITFGVYVPSAKNRERGDGRLSARLRSGSVLRGDRYNSQGAKLHPTQKPVGLMRALVESSSSVGETVLDPFAGVGSTLVAAVLSGRRAVGIEVDEKYAEIAARRISEAESLAERMAAA